MPGPSFGLDTLPLVDHHCHSVVGRPLDRAAFEPFISEAGAPAPGMTNFDTPLGFAIRRWCAPVLDLEPQASPQDYLARRADLGAEEVDRRFLRGTGIAALLVDTGLRSDELLPLSELGDRAGGVPTHEVVRLEAVAEEVARRGVSAAGFAGAFADELARRARRAIGLKTIVAYRFGLDFDPSPPSAAEVEAAAGEWLRGAESSGRWRLEHPTILRHLLWTGAQHGLPIQFHIGYGDPDIRLHRCNPSLLHEFLLLLRSRQVPVMLLHCYPYQREAAYLAASFPDVYFDLGEAIHYVGRSGPVIMAEALELAPFHKMVFSTDAFGVSELYYLGAFLFRRALGTVLGEAVSDGDWSEPDARRVALLIGAETARRVYRLPG
ncbi:MAG: amidohydrolase family protein [Candidatus Dormibacteraceae bacterium]